MSKSKLKKRQQQNKKPERVICPYCRSHAVLMPSQSIIRHEIDSEYVWVCSRYPTCDAYVAAHNETHIPMGPLANAELRKLRFRAHQVFDQIWKTGVMSKSDAYRWLSSSFSMKSKDAHIGQFGEYYCKEVIRLSEKVLNQSRKRA